ncbi:MAG TPA: hypothetical protein VMR41_00255 [Patescibacteria group bacterium]|nr:hypothetical protein [Patescibacteria group bacterium]
MEVENEKTSQQQNRLPPIFTPRILGLLADEIAKLVARRLPASTTKKNPKKINKKKLKQLEHALFLDTSAIIDGRISDVIEIGFFSGNIVVLDSVLLELKHIADSQDAVRRERGRRGLVDLEKIKKVRDIKLVVLQDALEKIPAGIEVDEKLIKIAKIHKGKIITCDYNLEKKATIEGVKAINVNALAQHLKVTAVPGEAVHIKVLHHGKENGQGVGYMDDGTMLVVEDGREDIGKSIDVVVNRVIQTAAGRILFSKKI